MKKIIAMLLCLLLLTGCTSGVPETTAPSEPEYIGSSPVPNIRTGIYSQTGAGNDVEVTDSGIYVLCNSGFGRSYLLYADHGSDTFVKLCARPDCEHSNRQCNAYFESSSGLYCDGSHLFVGEQSASVVKVFQLDPDGGNRTVVMDNADVRNGYRYSSSVTIRNGVCTFSLGKLENGNETETAFYFKLDGSMEQPEQAPAGYSFSYDDGRNILMVGPGKHAEQFQSGRYLWEPDTNTAQWIVDQPERYYGYVSVNGIYYMDGGQLCFRPAGTEEREVLFDTGLDGEYELEAYPDFFVVRDTVLWWKEGREEASLDDQTLRFYTWDFEYLGACEIDYPVDGSRIYEKIITGETKDRLYLAAYERGVPQYYIDKSDFGSEIKIHPLELPEDIEEFYREQYEESHLDPWEE
jgi:hypothetical protein